MLRNLQTTLNPKFSRPQHRVRRPRIPNQVNNVQEFIFNSSTISDPGTPTSMEEALEGNEKEYWKQSAKEEIKNFLKRGSWEKANRSEAILKGRKIIPCKWVFKIKNELNNTI